MTLTKDQIDSLYPAEIHFDRALNQGTIVSPPRWLSERVCDILDLVTGKKHSRQFSCATCLFHMYKEMGKIYFDSKLHFDTLEARELQNDTQEQPELQNDTKTGTKNTHIKEYKDAKTTGSKRRKSENNKRRDS